MIRQDWSTLKKLMFMKTAAGGGAAVEATATGNPLTFVTDLARPLKSLLIPFTPQQEGTDDPSPENIRSILPWNGLTVWSGGRNLCPLGTVTFSRTKKSYIGELPAGTYTISALVTSTDTDNTRCLLRLWKDDSPVGSDIYFTRNAREKHTITINEPFNYAYMYASDSYVHTEDDTATFADIQIETGSTATAYEPYKPITETDIVFPALGKNLLPESAVEYGSYGTDGGKIQDDNNKYRRLSIDLPAGNYVFSTDTPNCYFIRLLVDNVVSGTGGAVSNKAFTLANPANVKMAWRNADTTEITGTLHNQIETGSTPTAYEPFDNSVYGGTLDVVTGELWATWFVHNFLWSDKWYGSELTNVERRAFKLPNGVIPHTMSYYNDHKSEIKCNIAPLLWSYTTDNTHYYVDKDGDYYRALVFLPIGTSEDTQIQVGGTLADPVLITTITPAQITALLGNNTIWSDADGSMTATYLKKG